MIEEELKTFIDALDEEFEKAEDKDDFMTNLALAGLQAAGMDSKQIFMATDDTLSKLGKAMPKLDIYMTLARACVAACAVSKEVLEKHHKDVYDIVLKSLITAGISMVKVDIPTEISDDIKKYMNSKFKE